MIQKYHIDLLRQHSEKIYSNGEFINYQLHGDKHKRPYHTTPQRYERDPFSPVQNFLYKQCLFGLKAFDVKELSAMHPKKKHTITQMHRRTQKELNVLKQRAMIKSTNNILKLFYKSTLIKELIKETKLNPRFYNKLSFQDLGISKVTIINHLHKANILPSDFHTLK